MALVPSSSRGEPPSAGVTVLSYVELQTSVNVTGTSEAAATVVVTAGAITFDGTTLACIEVFMPWWERASNASALIIGYLYDGASTIGELGRMTNDGVTGVTRAPFLGRRFLTPTAAAHTYSFRCSRAVANATVQAGAGGAGAQLPGYIRVTSGG